MGKRRPKIDIIDHFEHLGGSLNELNDQRVLWVFLFTMEGQAKGLDKDGVTSTSVHIVRTLNNSDQQVLGLYR